MWLLRRNIKSTRPSDKLDHRRLGPFPISRKISPLAYELQLPSYLSRLHPVFHVSLLEPYSDPSEFHQHATPEPFTLHEDSIPSNSSLSIDSILDSRKIGHRYEYYVHWKSLPDEENSWVPLSDIPTTSNELIERFHRRHPRAPRPHRLILDQTFPPPVSVVTDDTFTSSSAPQMPSDASSSAASSSIAVARPARPAVPVAVARPASPPPVHENLRSSYTPPTQTTTRSGRISRPAARLDL